LGNKERSKNKTPDSSLFGYFNIDNSRNVDAILNLTPIAGNLASRSKLCRNLTYSEKDLQSDRARRIRRGENPLELVIREELRVEYSIVPISIRRTSDLAVVATINNGTITITDQEIFNKVILKEENQNG
jgi:hypothetical protein